MLGCNTYNSSNSRVYAAVNEIHYRCSTPIKRHVKLFSSLSVLEQGSVSECQRSRVVLDKSMALYIYQATIFIFSFLIAVNL